VVEALPAYGSHKPFSKWILPGRLRCGEDFLDADALNPTLASAIWRMRALTSAETSLSAGLRERDFHRQKRRNPARCQQTTVYGLTTTSTSAQRDQNRERTSQNVRSLLRRRGRPEVHRGLANSWRRARFSRAMGEEGGS